MPEVSLNDWKHFLHDRPGAHLLQTAEWGELKAAFGWEAVRIVCKDVGAQVLFKRLPFGWSVGYVPKPVFAIDSLVSTDGFWNEMEGACKRRRAVFLRVEPDAWEESQDRIAGAPARGLRRAPQNIQPPRTIVVALRGREEDLLSRMRQKCRYNIRLAEKKGVLVRPWNDLAGFHQMMLLTGGRDGFGVHSEEYYQRAYDLFHPSETCELFVAELEGRPLAALMVFQHGTRAWYLYGASTDEERNRMPTYLLQWEAMRWAKRRGCETYDLWGVPDADEQMLEANFESSQEGLWGVYRFKRGFGGEVKRAAQAMDRVFNPLAYQLYLLRTAGREEG